MSDIINNTKILQKEIEQISEDYDSLINPFYKDKNNKKVVKERKEKIEQLLGLYNDKEKELEKIQDDETRLIMRFKLKGYSIRKIARELHCSHTTIWKKIKMYYRGLKK